jgi:heme-degrading monooxygenase HmoA
MQLRPLDPAFPIDRQISLDASPVVLVNIFTVEAQDTEALLRAWEADANWMKAQPGFISTQLHKGIGESCVFLNYAVWQSTGHFRIAFTHPEFRKSLQAYPESAVASPHLFKKLTVANLCTE